MLVLCGKVTLVTRDFCHFETDTSRLVPRALLLLLLSLLTFF